MKARIKNRIHRYCAVLLPLLLIFGCDIDRVGGPDKFGYTYTSQADGELPKEFPPTVESSFGFAVDVDDNFVAVGQKGREIDSPLTNSILRYQQGKAYVYDMESETIDSPILEVTSPKSDSDLFGEVVAISGTLMAVGAQGDDTYGTDSGCVYLYDLSSATPTTPISILYGSAPGAEYRFGASLSLSGNWLIIGEPGNNTGAIKSGAVYVYDLAGATPMQPVRVLYNPTPAEGDGFGSAVAVEEQMEFTFFTTDLIGPIVAVGTPFDDTNGIDAGIAYIYFFNTDPLPTAPTVTLSNPNPIAGDRFGASIDNSTYMTVIGSPGNGGSVCVYDNIIAFEVELTSPASNGLTVFGSAVSISDKKLVVGSPREYYGGGNSGTAYLYDFAISSAVAETLYKPDPVNTTSTSEQWDLFGSAVAISGNRVVVGSHGDNRYVSDVGSVFTYRFPDSQHTNRINPPAVFAGEPELIYSDLSTLPGVPSATTQILSSKFTLSVDIGFEFLFYENAYSSCFINEDGYIQFSQGSVKSAPTQMIPNGANGELKNFIAPFWTDLARDSNSRVYYKTFGVSPNQVFVVQYNKFRQVLSNGSLGGTATFQVKLFEGSNAIEFQFIEISGFLDAPDAKNDVLIGIEDASGQSALPWTLVDAEALEIAAAIQQSSIRFERPIFVEVESTFTGPDGLPRTAAIGGKLSPHSGRFKIPYGSTKRFSAPEYVYLNKDLEELKEIGDINDPDPSKIAYYQLKNLGYAIDGETAQGTKRFFERTITRDIKVIWRWELEYAVIIESATGGTGAGSPTPGVGRFWYSKDSQFYAAIDAVVTNDDAGVRIENYGYSTTRYPIGEPPVSTIVDLNPENARALTNVVNIQEPLRIKWLSTGQVLYRWDASAGSPGESDALLNGRSFIRINGGDPILNNGANTPEWIDLGATVEVGSFYRTADRCFTLNDFVSMPSGDLFSLSSDVSRLADTNVNGEWARTTTVASVSQPTEIHWIYQPTIYRAEIPLGKSFDPKFPDIQLVPDLCDGGILSLSGPSELSLLQVGPLPEGQTDGGLPVRWDQVGKKLFPVHAGSNRIQWPDQNDPDKSYTIEIVSGYPGSGQPDLGPPVQLASERENEDGSRQGTAPDWVMTTTFDPVNPEFSGAPGAHYTHLFDEISDRRPPIKLDLSQSDEWAFQEVTYFDDSTDMTLDKAAPGVQFATSGPGRSVLLYSYRPNPDEAATGNLDKEMLAVRVVESYPIVPLLPDDEELVLGRYGLELGGNQTDTGAFGLISLTGSSPDLDPGNNFVIDFWLNTKGIKASDSPLTVFQTGGSKLSVTLDAASSTITANYLGITVTHQLGKTGPTWKHFVVHVFENPLFGFDVTIVDFYMDGSRKEQSLPTSMLAMSPPAISGVTEGLTIDSLQFGLDANPLRMVQLDQFRLFSLLLEPSPFLSDAEIRKLRTKRSTSLRSREPLLWFDFEAPPSGSSFMNSGTRADVAIGPVSDDPSGQGDYIGSWARTHVQEVATRIDSTLDDAGFGGSGYILNTLSNYNPNIYNRSAEVGNWGPVYPVNKSSLYLGQYQQLEVAYYQNPYLHDPILHPNVAWPYQAAVYNEVIYPTFGPHKHKAIYIASRIGSEGVDVNGRPQQIFSLDRYADLSIYNQPLRSVPGYNPNEEHALVAPSGRAALKVRNLGETLQNNPPLAAFALQKDINFQNPNNGYTSDPWVLVQVNNLLTGEPEMAAYQVRKIRFADNSIPFPRLPDSVVNETDGLSYESAASPENRFLIIDPDKAYNFSYDFEYPVFAGDLLIPPYPLNLVVGNAVMSDDKGTNSGPQLSFWRDVNGAAWVVSGGGSFVHQFHYPFRSDFFLQGVQPAPGTPVAWVPDLVNSSRKFTGESGSLNAGMVTYKSFWRDTYPKLKRGETLTYQGGEYFNENPGSNGLPSLVAMAAAEIVFDVATPSMLIGDQNINDFSARIIRVLDRHEALFTVLEMEEAGFSPAATAKVLIVAERWYFKDLPGSLQRRFYYDSLAEKLVFRGYLNDKDSGDSDLTSGPDPLNILEPNILTAGEYAKLKSLSDDPAWQSAVEKIYQKSQNSSQVRKDVNGKGVVIVDQFFTGMKESATFTKKIGLSEDQIQLAEEQEKLDVLAKLEAELSSRILFAGVDYLLYQFTGVSIEDQYVQARLGFTEEEVKENIQKIQARIDEKISSYGYDIENLPPVEDQKYAHLNSFGVGSALVPNPKLLIDSVDQPRYVTIAENNRAELDGAPVSLHIIEIIPDRYRGAIKVIEGADAFSEKVTLQHNGEFGANTDDLYYEWWIRDAGPLDVVADEVLPDGRLLEVDSQGTSLWQQYLPERDEEVIKKFTDQAIPEETARHLGLHSIVFEGRPDVALSDKLVLMRYKHISEVDNDGNFDNDWTLVPFEFADAAEEWQPGSPAPFQWAGAANSPQLQADGSKRYIPQLIMGWIKRVLDRINPYEARYTDFFGNESPATYSSQIQIAGAPYVGAVALNPDKNVIENVGLIELYETVLARAKALTIDNSSNATATDGINQALLLAATRLSVLYELLAMEAYTDAQDATITVTDISGLEGVESFTHSFQNMESDLLHEEMALLRGTDFGKSYPVYNRLFWNYAKGLGEAAYNVNYNIYDENTDGFINEDDARALYPQGHGDAWGHFVSAIGKHYDLLQNPGFSWKSRPELYAIMQNVLEVDFLDEQTFANLAAMKARVGRDIIRNTYRLHYTHDPDGQWQGYMDSVDPARAWGVSEWAHRSGQAAYFDWAIANALLPEDAADATPVSDPENLDRIERLGAIDEIGEVAAGLYEIQVAMDEANGGVNPLGFSTDAISFDIDPYFDGLGWERQTHFEQVYKRALEANQNALATLQFAAKIGNKLNRISDDTESMIVEALRQDIDYRNRLIEIFGRPYDGTIGFGKVYPEGYEGPDTQLFAYLDRIRITQIVPETDQDAPESLVRFQPTIDRAVNLSDTLGLITLYGDVFANIYENLAGAVPFLDAALSVTADIGREELNNAFITLEGSRSYEDFSTVVPELMVPVRKRSRYAFQASEDWGQRTSYGKIQRILEEELRERVALDTAINEYIAWLQDFEVKTNRLFSEVDLMLKRRLIFFETKKLKLLQQKLEATKKAIINVAKKVEETAEKASEGGAEALPTSAGFSIDVTAPARGGILTVSIAAQTSAKATQTAASTAIDIAKFLTQQLLDDLEEDKELTADVKEIEGLLVDLVSLSGSDIPRRNTIGTHLQNIEILQHEYISAVSEGYRLLREREAFNKILSAKAQKNRYNDMVLRLSRNEAMTKYQSAFNNAARYAWLAARVYDYETSLDPGDPAAVGGLLDEIVRERQLGLWIDGQPAEGGLAEILSKLHENYSVLKGQLGLNNPQSEVEKISLRSELFRIGPGVKTAEGLSSGGTAASDDRWEDTLKVRIVPDLTVIPEFTRYCRPFSAPEEGPQPGLVIRFNTEINNGVNFFGNVIIAGDHTYSTANFATKVRGFGVWLENYNDAGLATTPRAYMVPVGNDYLRTSSSPQPMTRVWSVVEQRIPTPYVINKDNLVSPGFIPSLNGIDGEFNELRRHGDFRMYHDNGDPEADDSELILDSRLIGRSVWNSDWMLIIPGANLHVDPMTGLEQLAETITDIKLHFKTYSHQGQ